MTTGSARRLRLALLLAGLGTTCADVLVLQRDWTPATCSAGTCKPDYPNTFSVRSLFLASDESSAAQTGCGSKGGLKKQNLVDAGLSLEELECAWQNQEANLKSLQASWKASWEEYGKCTPADSAQTYLALGLQLDQKYRLPQGLPASLNGTLLTAALLEAFNAWPLVQCDGNTLTSVWLCFDPTTLDAPGGPYTADCPWQQEAEQCGGVLEVPRRDVGAGSCAFYYKASPVRLATAAEAAGAPAGGNGTAGGGGDYTANGGPGDGSGTANDGGDGTANNGAGGGNGTVNDGAASGATNSAGDDGPNAVSGISQEAGDGEGEGQEGSDAEAPTPATPVLLPGGTGSGVEGGTDGAQSVDGSSHVGEEAGGAAGTGPAGGTDSNTASSTDSAAATTSSTDVEGGGSDNGGGGGGNVTSTGSMVGALVGGVAGGMLLGVAVMGTAFAFWKRGRRTTHSEADAQASLPDPEKGSGAGFLPSTSAGSVSSWSASSGGGDRGGGGGLVGGAATASGVAAAAAGGGVITRGSPRPSPLSSSKRAGSTGRRSERGGSGSASAVSASVGGGSGSGGAATPVSSYSGGGATATAALLAHLDFNNSLPRRQDSQASMQSAHSTHSSQQGVPPASGRVYRQPSGGTGANLASSHAVVYRQPSGPRTSSSAPGGSSSGKLGRQEGPSGGTMGSPRSYRQETSSSPSTPKGGSPAKNPAAAVASLGGGTRSPGRVYRQPVSTRLAGASPSHSPRVVASPTPSEAGETVNSPLRVAPETPTTLGNWTGNQPSPSSAVAATPAAEAGIAPASGPTTPAKPPTGPRQQGSFVPPRSPRSYRLPAVDE